MFNLLHYWRKARTLPPKIVLKKFALKMRSLLSNKLVRSKDKLCLSFFVKYSPSSPLMTRLDCENIFAVNIDDAASLALLCDYYLEHRFDLLGSGWVQVRRGMNCRGLEGHRYQMACSARPEQDFLDNANYGEVRSIRQSIATNYQPIDWHLDFKSGYRWDPKTWYRDISYGHLPGVDIKVPWELSRMQHLPQLALAYGCAIQDMEGFADPEKYLDDFRNQVLDFIAANPPRFGVNWVCTMDVAIRVANWLYAYDIFKFYGAKFDSTFELYFHRSIFEHGMHIVNNLEWSPELRGNHYLANIVGLTFVSSYLPQSPLVDAWLAFSVQELIAETLNQFNYDGSNFEGSTAYHGLSAEMVAYACALVLGLPTQKREGMLCHDSRQFKNPLGLKTTRLELYTIPGHTETSPFPPAFWERLIGMAYFAAAITRPDGLIAQIGDNDSGRFFKLRPSVEITSVASVKQSYFNLKGYSEQNDQDIYPLVLSLDHSFVIATISALVDGLTQIDRYESIINSHESLLVGLLASGYKAKAIIATLPYKSFAQSSVIPATGSNHKQYIFSSIDIDLSDKINQQFFPDFGLYVWKGKNLFLTVRCGSLGQNGYGGHSHNDQLAIELWIDRVPIIVDPGTYLYTPCVEKRNQYRSVRCHFAPQFVNLGEPGSLLLGIFSLGNESKAVTHYADNRRFIGEHKGFGFSVFREVVIESDGIYIRDSHNGSDSELVDYHPRPFSMGYGWIDSKPMKSGENY